MPQRQDIAAVAMQIIWNADDLKPLVTAVVSEVLARREVEAAKLGDKEVFDEPEAADRLGLRAKQLREIRLRGEITFVRISGRFVKYRRRDLIEFLERHAVNRTT